MEITSALKCPMIDCHVHYADPSLMPGLIRLMDQLGIRKFNIVCTPHLDRLSLLPDALHLKGHYPERVYVFGGLDISALFIEPDRAGRIFAEYVETLIELGCDGIKMIEGKPQIRKMLPIPAFDSDVLDPYWKKLEETGMPVIFHLNDPEEFWDKERIPQWALDRDWFYGDGEYVNNEDQYTEVINVLSRYPDLRVIFAHFFFLSGQLPRLTGYMDRFPNMGIDLTPGIEMYSNFSANWNAAREFFTTYQDRIYFGTDIGAKALLEEPNNGIELSESTERVQLVRRFL
ncbi:MAG: amidohydrolase family protein, partial [Proteobacteria bacterium]|nr:amidohydrolase family protein [Pseudomonadota bacterium]